MQKRVVVVVVGHAGEGGLGRETQGGVSLSGKIVREASICGVLVGKQVVA